MASLSKFGGRLDRRLAAHLLRRTSYLISKARIDEFDNLTVSEATGKLFSDAPLSMGQPIDPITGNTWINNNFPFVLSSEFELRNYTIAWWINEARKDTSIKSKLSYFLHTNFVIQEKKSNSRDLFDYFGLLRHYAYGSIKKLSVKLTLCNLMLKHLDNGVNNAQNPNENYAREFLELFTIGRGPQIGPSNYTNYTELDVKQAARVLTGIKYSYTRGERRDSESNIPLGLTNYYTHDKNEKVFSTAFQSKVIQPATDAQDMYRELDEFVDMVFDQQETARNICRKMYRFFVSKNITEEIENDIIEPLSVIMQASDYNMEFTLKTLLESEHFYDMDDSDNKDEIIGGLIKSPLELLLTIINYFHVYIPGAFDQRNQHYKEFYLKSVIETIFANSSFPIFNPDVVAGHPAYFQAPEYDKNWFNSTTIITRYKIPEMFATGKRAFTGGDLAATLNMPLFLKEHSNISNPENVDELVRTMSDDLFCEPIDEERYDYFKNEIFLDGSSESDWTEEWNNYKNSGFNSNVKIPLNNLFMALTYSQEFQAM